MRPLVVTGATGFVGRRLLSRLPVDADIRLLVRDPSRLPALPSGWRIATGDLLDPTHYRDALIGAETVVHLAARTGPGRPEEHHRQTVTATELLLAEAKRAGVRRFLFISSIAAGYRDRRHYHYATAKLAAEARVAASGLETLIVRPTMILGPGSAVLANLAKLARLPWPVIFGSGQAIQPVHVDDVAEAIAAAVNTATWPTTLLEYGGPTVLSMAEFLALIRTRSGLPTRGPWHLPLEPLRTVLGLVEPVLGRLLPFTAGQLAAFANPAVVAVPGPSGFLPPASRGLDEMVPAG